MRFASRSARVAVVAVAFLALAACTDSANSADADPAESEVSTETVIVDISEVVNATSDVPSLVFSVDISSQSTVILSTTGVVDVAELRGFRSDSAGLDGTGLEPIAEVWLESENQFQSVDGMPAEPTNGGLASFLGTNGPHELASLNEVIAHWIGTAEPQRASRDTVGGIVATRFTLERPDRMPLEV